MELAYFPLQSICITVMQKHGAEYRTTRVLLLSVCGIVLVLQHIVSNIPFSTSKEIKSKYLNRVYESSSFAFDVPGILQPLHIVIT